MHLPHLYDRIFLRVVEYWKGMKSFMINILTSICTVLLSLIGLLYIYRSIYAIVGLFHTKKFPQAAHRHKYAVIIAARNEETVIGNLIDSIHKQDYPGELVTTFVVADNCTDKTADVTRKHGAICYERFDAEHCTKGFALEFLFAKIQADYGIDTFEGYFVFDADNLLKRDFITRMNDAFDSGEKIIASYRNTKNFDDNWISASYALHFLRTARFENRGRSSLGLSTWIQGCGFLIANELVRDGWHYTTLAEDRSFSADSIARGMSICYQHEAEFYDEQPTSLKVTWRQRLRWAKGHLQAFAQSSKALLRGIFKKESARKRFMCYDMFMVNCPSNVVLIPLKLIKLALMVFSFFAYGILAGNWFLFIFKILQIVLFEHLANIPLALIIFIMERKRIKPIKWYKKLFYCLTFPLFSIIGDIATCIAVFKRVSWKPIPHQASVKIEEIEAAAAKSSVAKPVIADKNTRREKSKLSS